MFKSLHAFCWVTEKLGMAFQSNISILT
uniref:Uncharacterized protein n=1 Tax=Anguilla anguilla TaxID=7936 RepID=A0A0E9V1D3_ANGAN